MGNWLFEVIFPRRCVGCGRIGYYICPTCQKTLILRDPLCPECDRPAIDGATHSGCKRAFGVDGLTTAFRYTGVMKKAIKQLKYRFVYDEVETLINLIPLKILQQIPKGDWVIYPIPLHKDRLNWRGFNQAEKLAQVLGKRLNLRVASGLLIRQAKRIPQADISHREDRIKNARGLFSLHPNVKLLKYPNILLIDDVWTTGATMKEATKVLKRKGVKRIWGFTLAR